MVVRDSGANVVGALHLDSHLKVDLGSLSHLVQGTYETSAEIGLHERSAVCLDIL